MQKQMQTQIQSGSSQPKSKKQKTSSSLSSSSSSSSSSTSKAEPILKVNSLQSQLSNSTDLNPLNELIQLTIHLARGTHSSHSSHSSHPSSESDSKALLKSINVLCKALTTLLSTDRIPLSHSDPEGLLIGGTKLRKGEDEAAAKVRLWLRNRWNESVLLLCALLAHANETIRTTSLRQILSLQKSASSSSSRLQSNSNANPSSSSSSGQWSPSPFRALVLTLLAGPPTLDSISIDDRQLEIQGKREEIVRLKSEETELESQEAIKKKFADDYLERFDDVRFLTCREISSILKNPPDSAKSAPLRSAALSILVLLTAIPTKKSDLNAFWVDELSVAPQALSSKKGKGKKKGVKGKGKVKKFSEDGDSEEGEEEDEEEDGDESGMEGWFSDSEDEGANNPSANKGLIRKNSQGLDLSNKNEKKLEKENRNRRRRNPPLIEALHLIAAQKAAFSNAWLDLLLPRISSYEAEHKATGEKKKKKERESKAQDIKEKVIGGELSLSEIHEILLRLHSQILPHLTKPNQLHDFLVDCLSFGGPTSLLALNGIFTLIVQHNLDFPSFYVRLYSLLDSNLLHLRYRSRFLRLLEVFLSSTHLPSKLVASFLKRLSRLSLRSSPSSIIALIPLMYNLLKKHPSCMVLIHRTFSDRFSAGPMGIRDGFLDSEKDPMKTNALEESSLWEIASFGAAHSAMINMGLEIAQIPGAENHYFNQVATLDRILSEPFTRERYDLEDFLDITYGTLFENETFKTLQRREEGSKGKGPMVPALNHSFPASSVSSSSSKSESPFQTFPTRSSSSKTIDRQELNPNPNAKRKRYDEGNEKSSLESDAVNQAKGNNSAGELAADDDDDDRVDNDDDDDDKEEKEAMKHLENLRKKGADVNTYAYASGKLKREEIQDPIERLWSF